MRRLFTLLAFAAALAASAARAETQDVRSAQQFGLSYLPLMIMEDGKLVEKQARAMGLGEIKASWIKLSGAGPMNDALLSGSLDFASGGVPPLITLWARTKGTPLAIRGVASLNNMPVELITANPAVQSIRDLTDKDKIAMPAIKISTQALLLQMAAAKEWGRENYAKLDALTISMGHPDAMLALFSGSAGITGHFSAPPFQYQEKAKPGYRSILLNYDVLGGPATFNVVWTTAKFRDANPKTYAAFLAALREAIDAINADRRAAVQTYKRMTGTTETIEDLLAMLDDPRVEMTPAPKQIMKTADFMHQTGAIKIVPESWKDLFFDNIHDLPGS